MDTKTKNSSSNKDIRELLNLSANRNNTMLIFFFSFGLYVFISTINTSDIALLLPRHSFKMPFIDFELSLLHFYILAPLLLLLLHFNLLFNHYKNLEKLDKYKNKIDLTTINPSLYGFAFVKEGNFQGFMVNLILYILLYILPLVVFTTIYIRFADYHHQFITPLHLLIIMIDLLFIGFSIVYSAQHSYFPRKKISTLKLGLYLVPFIATGVIMIEYFYSYYYPLVYTKYDPLYAETIKNKFSCQLINGLYTNMQYEKDLICYPRLVVQEEEMAKISKSALYIPRYLTMHHIDKANIEHDLIIAHGTRIDLSNRNLRYAVLKGNILTRANLKNTQLQASNLINAHMQAVDLENADLTDAVMMYTELEYASLIGINLQGANLVNAQMQNIDAFTAPNSTHSSNFMHAKMQNVNLINAKFMGANLSNVNLERADLNGTNFTNANLANSSFVRAHITSSQFINANLTDANFSEAIFILFGCKQLSGMPTSNDEQKCGAPNFRGTEMLGVNLNTLMKKR